ncbi:MAG: cbb3-type cytochrome c oxidase N-terminal domain-containing protein, partial [Myxococcales bacterium]
MGEHQHRPGVLHVYDGIEEEDNQLPNWWLGILWGTVIFAFGYWIYYEVTHSGPGQMAAYELELAVLARANADAKPVDDGVLAALARDSSTVELGRDTFAKNCASCHATR